VAFQIHHSAILVRIFFHEFVEPRGVARVFGEPLVVGYPVGVEARVGGRVVGGAGGDVAGVGMVGE